ncbi:MAG TPA: F0F1 ATP synthase subunit A [Bacilli bacterium]|nr:F0F1 ATP synthase subunit A [Bacilli bacterium]
MEHLYPTIGEGIWTVNLTIIGMSVLCAAAVFILARVAAAGVNLRNPKGLANFFEWIIDFVGGLAKDMVGTKYAQTYVPLAFTLILYLFISNQLGLITNIVYEIDQPSLGVAAASFAEGAHEGKASVAFFMSPTANLMVTMGLSIAMVGLSHIIGLRNPKSYFKHYFEPNPAFFILHLIDELAKFATLGLRLFGNIFAGEVMIAVILTMPTLFGVPVSSIPLIVWLAYSLFVGTIQAFVFTVLTLVYIGQKLPHDEAH